jgi:outer membrane immunogenic protein
VKRFLLATVSVVALTGATRAADMPATMPAKGPMYEPVATWDGAYVGVQGGVVRRDGLFNQSGGVFGGSLIAPFQRDGSKTGAAVGLQLGYNWQRGSFVYGFEGDWSWAGAKTSATHLNGFISDSFDVNSIATLRGRAGLVVESTLFYLTGGAAFGHIRDKVAILQGNGATGFSFTQEQTKVGWTVGAGVEHEFAPHWTARAELRYIDLGKTSVDCTPGTGPCFGPGYRGEFSNSLWLGLVGLNYKFGGDRAADWFHAQAYAPAQVPTWMGAYLGIQGGIAQNYAAFENSDCFLTDCTLIDRRKTNGTVGGLLGYNWQRGSFVYGVEGDWNWIHAKSSRLDPNVNSEPVSRSISFEANWLATARGRVGLTFDSTLLYVTGGLALGHVKGSVELNNLDSTGPLTGLVASFSQNQTKVGWTAGVGAEYMLSPHWTARAEFRYVDLGKSTATCQVTGGLDFNTCVRRSYRGEFSNTLKLGLVGLAYKF